MAQTFQPSSQPRRQSKAAQKEAAEPLAHPEEMRASGEVRIGNYIYLKGTARITPAGLICAGIAGVAVLVAAASLVRATRR